ncbi:MAG: S8 family serine peptidase [Brasilonema octagenarum HA4186-MV1]|jgi:subtilisin family serine protease|nr:S8 family serine peptidase [Brasilonema octagenarum HA4186-MV1]
MESDQYIILRDTSRVDLSEPFSGRSFTLEASRTVEAPTPRIDIESLDTRDLFDLRRDPQVVSIAPPMPVALIEPTASEEAQTHDQLGTTTWGVSVTAAVDSPFTGQGVTVAVLDTGIDANHEAFKGVQLIEQDFTGEGNGDKNGHGTHCAGTIFGQVVNGYRFSMAPGVQRALIGKVLDSQGHGGTAQIYRAILWALDQGAHVISMSLGMNFPAQVENLMKEKNFPAPLATSKALENYRANVRLFDKLADLVNARNALFQQGTVIVAASGNDSKRNIDPNYILSVAPPAAADGIISVGALETPGEPNNALKVAYFSNTGPNVAAPGVKIYSAKPGGGYRYLNGTSMATPHVAGIAALWAEKLLKQNTTVNRLELSSRLIGQAKKDRLAAGFNPLDVGAGLVQAPLN